MSGFDTSNEKYTGATTDLISMPMPAFAQACLAISCVDLGSWFGSVEVYKPPTKSSAGAEDGRRVGLGHGFRSAARQTGQRPFMVLQARAEARQAPRDDLTKTHPPLKPLGARASPPALPEESMQASPFSNAVRLPVSR